ncbi:MAG: hypothetical protein O7D30_12400, partial [Rickettsia endosymbiont of Ixodes persulcatus]|nr:hypothetical protein [Rickettsia endosymbiont of Ixodes persulcatus]
MKHIGNLGWTWVSNLRKVEFDPNTGKPVAHSHSKSAQNVNKPNEIALILARRVAVEMSDS